ncbi:galanin receptor type 1 [Candoia aspera]|uniref:galanin receptor type 1 n=1 Tax=Candoia aspera TaxID=51853 RepID=UPI002FD87BF9
MAAEAPATTSDLNQTWGSSWLDSNASRSPLPQHFSFSKEKISFLSEIGIENFITLIAFGLIFTLGVMGNSLVITVLTRNKPGKPRSTTNIFVLNLSIADLAYLLFCIPFQSTVYMLPSWALGTFICKFIHYFFTVSMLVSIFTLSAMSVDRYVAIVHSRRSSSLRVSRNALLGVGIIWLISIAMASPVAHHQRIVHQELLNQTYCWEVWPDLQHKKVYVLCTFIFGYLLPLLLISFCYAKVLNHLHKKLRNISKKSEASKKKTAQTVLAVVVVFGISWLPHHVVHLWAEFGDFPLTQASFLFRITAHCLAYSNSSVNPIIYAFLSENFRKAYKQVFECQISHNSPLNEVKDNKSNIDTPPSTNSTHV